GPAGEHAAGWLSFGGQGRRTDSNRTEVAMSGRHRMRRAVDPRIGHLPHQETPRRGRAFDRLRSPPRAAYVRRPDMEDVVALTPNDYFLAGAGRRTAWMVEGDFNQVE